MSRYRGRRSVPAWCKALLALILAGILTFSALLGAVLWGSHDDLHGDPQVMVILGCQVKPWGPSILLQDRLDTALDYWEDHPELLVVVSGGQGPDEPESEARAMADYLIDHGVAEDQILLEDQSHNTWQNLTYTLALLREQEVGTGQVLVVSNGFHLTRVRMLFGRAWEGTYTLSTLAAPTSHLPSRLKMYIREPIGLVKSFFLDW
jgi:uncharacterized SAM-binding protein YcdF (DUF218 family)